MTYPRAPSNAAIREYAVVAAMSILFVVCLPLLAILFFLLRGAIVAAVLLAILSAAAWWVWRSVLANLPPTGRMVMREYVGPAILGIGIVACLPVLAVGAFVLQGAVLAALAIAVAVAAIVSVWHCLYSARVAARERRRVSAK